MIAIARMVRPDRTRTSSDRPGRRCRLGQSMVELAIAMPFMLLLMLGTIDLGRMFFSYVEIRNAVREGAAYASHNPTDTAGAQARVTGHGDFAAGATVTGPTISGSCNSLTGSGQVTMTATRTFTPLTTSFLSNWGLGSVNLGASATMRCMN
jgi:Flp pilus assembly protein TadG